MLLPLDEGEGETSLLHTHTPPLRYLSAAWITSIVLASRAATAGFRDKDSGVLCLPPSAAEGCLEPLVLRSTRSTLQILHRNLMEFALGNPQRLNLV